MQKNEDRNNAIFITHFEHIFYHNTPGFEGKFKFSFPGALSYIQIRYLKRIVLYELPSLFHLISHENGKDLIRLHSVFHLTLTRVLFWGSMVVFHNCSGFISPRPL